MCAGNSLAAALQPSSDSNCSFLSYAYGAAYAAYAAQVIPEHHLKSNMTLRCADPCQHFNACIAFKPCFM